MGKKNIFKSIGDGFSHAADDTGKWFKGAGKTVGHGLSDAAKWGEHTAGSVGKTLLNFGDKQISKVTDIFSSPTFLIVAGAVIVAIIVLK